MVTAGKPACRVIGTRPVRPDGADTPMFDALLAEKPNPGRPCGVRGVGEAPIVPPLAAIANAIHAAAGVRMRKLPASPRRVLGELLAAREPA